MPTVNALHARKILGRKGWFPPEPWGPDGWCFGSNDYSRSIIASAAWKDGVEWVHASFAYSDKVTVPTHDDLMLMHEAIYGGGYAYQVFPSIDKHALHLFGRADGQPVLPEFATT